MRYIVYGVLFVIAVFLLRFLLNRPSKLKREHEERMKAIKEKSKGKYDEIRTLPKDRKKYS